MKIASFIAITIALAAASGCGDGEPTAAAMPAPAEAAPAPTNRIDLPATVRQNLGITFAKVEKRRVSSTIRVPGSFELQPSARREYRSTLSGWINLRVQQYAEVAKGQPVYELDSPEWHRLRQQLHENQAAIARVTAEMEVAQQTKAEAEKAVEVVQKRIEALAGAEVRRAELEAELATRRNSIPRLEAEVRVKQAALDEAKHDFALEIDTAAAVLGLTSKSLSETVEPDDAGHGADHQVQRWFTINRVEFPATDSGVVESMPVTNGAWVEANTLVATVVQPNSLRFRAVGLQSDLGRLRDGQTAFVVPPQGSGIDGTEVITGKLKVGLTGDPDQRTIELIVTPEKVAAWAKPGVSALLEIVVDGTGKEELAIPLASVVRDDLTHIFFRRDPSNADKVIRMEADLGVNDGKWIAVQSGVKAGDEVVLEGVYELKLAGGGKGAGGGGHFHADGTWHPDADK